MEWHTERVWCNFSLSPNVLFRWSEKQLIRLVSFLFYLQRNLFLLETRLCLPVFPDKRRCCQTIANRWRLIFVCSLLISSTPIFSVWSINRCVSKQKIEIKMKNKNLFVCLKMFTIFKIVCYWMLVSSAKSMCLLSAPGTGKIQVLQTDIFGHHLP